MRQGGGCGCRVANRRVVAGSSAQPFLCGLLLRWMRLSEEVLCSIWNLSPELQLKRNQSIPHILQYLAEYIAFME